jgi:hypothetical protein
MYDKNPKEQLQGNVGTLEDALHDLVDSFRKGDVLEQTQGIVVQHEEAKEKHDPFLDDAQVSVVEIFYLHGKLLLFLGTGIKGMGGRERASESTYRPVKSKIDCKRDRAKEQFEQSHAPVVADVGRCNVHLERLDCHLVGHYFHTEALPMICVTMKYFLVHTNTIGAFDSKFSLTRRCEGPVAAHVQLARISFFIAQGGRWQVPVDLHSY